MWFCGNQKGYVTFTPANHEEKFLEPTGSDSESILDGFLIDFGGDLGWPECHFVL